MILQLYGLHAPIPVLNYFLARISDTQHRLALSQRVGAEKSVVDSFVELKDKQKLETFIETITPGTDVRFYAENALKNLVNFDKVQREEMESVFKIYFCYIFSEANGKDRLVAQPNVRNR